MYKKAQAFDEILEGMTNAIQHSVKEGIELDEAVGIMTGQVVYKYEEEQEMKKFNVQITYTGMIEETIEAESLEEAEFEADVTARLEAPFDCDEYEINVEEAQEND
ncbi:hypothetical protein CSC52_0674 [Staphylococcus aureus]|nr:hypothetical protein CSC52_0674 [Staphylococcus aureus]